MIKNIIFDFGGVLADWNPHYLYDAYFGDVKQADWFLENICTSEWNHTMDAGKPFSQAVEELSAKYPEWKEEISIYKTRWAEMMGEDTPGMMDFIKSLKSGGFNLYGLTNWSDETIWAMEHFMKELDGTVVSGREKVAKPDIEIFRRLLARFSLKSEECLYIDDIQRNLDVAAELGIKGYLFTGPEELKRDFFCIVG